MISEVYDAFRTAGVPDDKARKAAEALSAENLATKTHVHEIKATQRLQSWIIGFNLFFTTAIFWKILA